MFDRDEDKQAISLIIEEGLEAILTGRASLGDVLRQHPEKAAQLQPELETALWLISRQQQVSPRPGFLPASRKRVVDRIKREILTRETRRSLLVFPRLSRRNAFQWVAALVVVILILTSTTGVIAISQNALPDQQLYSIKRISEEVAIGLTWRVVNRAELRAEFTERRIDEIEVLVALGNYTALPETLSDFEQEVNQSVVLLQKVSDRQINKKGELAIQMLEDFAAYATRLDVLKTNAPGEALASLDRARDISMNGASIASEVYKDIQEKKAHGTGTPNLNETAPSTNNGVNETVVPDDGANQGNGKNKEKPNLDSTDRDPKPTKTPKLDKDELPDDPDTEELEPTLSKDDEDTLDELLDVKPTKEEKDKDK